ncbi:unnamed protein product [Sympodiomycopsis kandeliae]
MSTDDQPQAGSAHAEQKTMPLYLPSSTSIMPNQSIVTPPPPSHWLSAADDLIDRFQLHDSYRAMLQPFRKDLIQSSGGKATLDSGSATPGTGNYQQQSKDSTFTPVGNPKDAGGSATLPRTFSHFLPPSLPGKVRPPKPPRRSTLHARRLAAQAGEDSQPSDKKEKAQAKAAAEWEKVSTTLRKAVMKPEYTAADIRPLDEEAMRGYQVEAGEVEDIDRSLLEADIPGPSPPRKKKKKSNKGSAAAGAQDGPK